MPTYDYKCINCDYRDEISHKISEEPRKICPKCHQEGLRRGFGGGNGLHFKGSGFYITDYPKKQNSSADNSSSASSDAAPQPPSASKCCPCGKEASSCSTY